MKLCLKKLKRRDYLIFRNPNFVREEEEEMVELLSLKLLPYTRSG